MNFCFLQGLIPKGSVPVLGSLPPWVRAGKLPWGESKASPAQESCRDSKHLPGSLVCEGLGAPPVSKLVFQEDIFFPCPSGIQRKITTFTV